MKLPIALATTLLAAIPLSAAVSPPRPNIVFFLIDDLGYADCGFSGGKEIRTPHIDALAGGSLEQPLPIDGINVWPLLTEQAPSPHEFILSAQSPDQAALRLGDWKLVMSRSAKDAKGKKPAGSIALYDLAKDPSETTDLAASEPARLAEMKAKLEEILKEALPTEERAIK